LKEVEVEGLMSETADGAETKLARAGEPVARAAIWPLTSRLSDPDWLDWCDADR
jgi:hypothetical protein